MGNGQERGSLEGRRALVVGGTGGIGAAAALALASRGSDIFLLGGRDESRMARSLENLRRFGVRSEGRALDFDSLDTLEAESLLEGDDRFDILVVAYGPFAQRPLAATGSKDWRKFALLDLALPGMIASFLVGRMAEKGWGRLVFFGGTGTDTIKGYRTNAAYAAAKTGLGVLAKSLALEHADDGVASFVVCPGLVDTEYLDEETREGLRAKAPRSLLIQSGSIGESAVELLAADPCLVSGSVLSMDAGLAFARG